MLVLAIYCLYSCSYEVFWDVLIYWFFFLDFFLICLLYAYLKTLVSSLHENNVIKVYIFFSKRMWNKKASLLKNWFIERLESYFKQWSIYIFTLHRCLILPLCFLRTDIFFLFICYYYFLINYNCKLGKKSNICPATITIPSHNLTAKMG